MAMTHRDDAHLAARLTDWLAHTYPAGGNVVVDGTRRPSAGWSNETVLVTVSWEHPHDAATAGQFVLRLPTIVPSFPVYDLAAQARVLGVVQRAGIPSPRVIAFEADERWLGAPFLVMSYVPGRSGPEAPGLDPWLTEAPLDEQRALHERFLATLAAIHRVDWQAGGLEGVLRGHTGAMRDEVGWWAAYIEWAANGAPARLLADAAQWCAQHVPANEPTAALCWGDARLGNVMFDPRRAITAVLDWELASIGPPEMDLAWYLVLDELTAKFTKPVPGFLARDVAISYYEAQLGRPVVDLEWHEIFALVRSAAINDRQARMAADAGVAYPGVAGDDNPVLRYVARRIERYGSTP
jgi:aminoglycoside phosphotransferase (APT) family kinase protein